jgi:signal transduction histidine kinase
VNQAVRRSPDNIEVGVGELEDGGYAIEISDDGVGERRRASMEAIEERVRVLNGRFSVEHGDESGTMVRVVIPGYVAAVEGGE